MALAPVDVTNWSDVAPVLLAENAQAPSGSPDADSWADDWVDRTAANVGVHEAVGAQDTFQAVTSATELDAYLEFSGVRFQVVAGTGTSTLVFKVTWPTVVANPNATVQVDFKTFASRPFVESAITATSIGARVVSGAPFSQRVFTFPQDGTTRTHTVTLTASEVNAILGNWLLAQYTVPDLTVGSPFLLQGRRAAAANQPVMTLSLQR
jgi:hypothetical protein